MRLPRRLVSVAVLLGIITLSLPALATAQSIPPASPSLIVKLINGLPPQAQDAVIVRNGGTLVSSIPALRLFVVAVLPSDLAAAIARYQADPEVQSVEANKLRVSESIPSDPLYPNQWYLSTIGWDQVFGTVTPTGSAKVAVLDTGIDASHPDLTGKVVPGTSILDGSNGMIDPSGHGTWLAGIIAAQTDGVPGEGIAAVGYAGVQVMPVTVLNANGEGLDSDVIAGVIWAADNGADVILMAFSNPGFSQNLQDAIDYAWSRGVVLVASAGNNASGTPHFPAGDRGVMGVAATDQGDVLASFSNDGEAVFIAAPGVGIQTIDIGGSYTVISGTSAAAAQVAGLAAFMKAMDPALPNGVIVYRIASTADPAGTQAETGNGRINMPRALASTDTTSIQPAGAAPVGGGGPFVGPYVANNHVLTLSCVSPAAINTPSSCTATVTGGTMGQPSSGRTVTFSGGTGTFTPLTCVTGGTNATASCFVNFTPTATGNHVITASVAFAAGGHNDSDTFTVTVPAAPTVALTGPTTANEGDTKTYNFTVTDPGDTFTVKSGFPDCGTGGTLVGGSLTVNAGGGSFQCSFPDGPASPTVRIQVTDSGGLHSNIASIAVTVSNMAPTVALTGPTTANEGDTKTYDFTVTDPGQDTFTVKSGFPDCGTGGTLVGSPTVTASGGSFQCSFPDGPASPTVRIQVTDSDGADGNIDAIAVTVANRPPSVTLTGASTANEGETKTYNLSVTDPGQDTFTVKVSFPDCGTGGTLVGSPTVTASGGSFQCSFPDGPASPTVRIQVTDSDGADSNIDAIPVTVANLPPSVTLTGPSTANEGETKTYNFTVTEPGQDTFTVKAGFPSCGTGGTLVGTPAVTASGGSFQCSFPDGPASPTVRMQVTDSDGADSNIAYVAVTVSNLPPTATLSNNGPVSEGSPVTVSFSNQFDPSSADTAAGFHYAYSCTDGDLSGATYAGSGTSASTMCTFDDGPATKTVKARIIDKDNGFTEYKTYVTVNNVPPTITAVTPQPPAVLVGQTVTFTGTATDPSTADTTAGFRWAWDAGSGYGPFGAPHANSFQTSYGVCGTYTVNAKAQDKDNGVSAPYTSSAVGVWNGNFLPPLREGTSNLVQKGRVVPVQISFGCNGHASGLAPAIQLLSGDFVSNAGTESTDNYIETLSVSNADTTGRMREVDSKYIYNLAIPNNSSWTPGYPLTVRVSPFGNGTFPVMYILLEIRR